MLTAPDLALPQYRPRVMAIQKSYTKHVRLGTFSEDTPHSLHEWCLLAATPTSRFSAEPNTPLRYPLPSSRLCPSLAASVMAVRKASSKVLSVRP